MTEEVSLQFTHYDCDIKEKDMIHSNIQIATLAGICHNNLDLVIFFDFFLCQNTKEKKIQGLGNNIRIRLFIFTLVSTLFSTFIINTKKQKKDNKKVQ